METRILRQNQMNDVLQDLHLDGVVAFPTDTVYGLAVKLSSPTAILKLTQAKNRPLDKPYPVLVSSLEQIESLAQLTHRDRQLIKQWMPGSVTFVFKKNPQIQSGYFAESETIAFRCPTDIWIKELLDKVMEPLLLTSANISGDPACVTSDEVIKHLSRKIDCVIEGHAGGGIPSTIIDASHLDLQVIRKGEVSMNDILKTSNTVALACDHGAYPHKEAIKARLLELGYIVEDFGTKDGAAVDYPDTVYPAAKSVSEGKNTWGIVLCGTGIGASITANKVKGIRCALVFDQETARITREHNDSNILALGGRLTDVQTAVKIAEIWLSSPFSNDERHIRRINKVKDIENKEKTGE
ncbi:MAG: threonylcarbamoyl-AMP synthase [Erysipelotrichaceae bacterium]|nr:threonylcarbamoyl-AMP synthase [Erysipelotrichaceae bacterium]